MSDDFLSKTYRPLTSEETTEHYDRWAATYDAEISANGYATPGRCAAALAKAMPDRAAPVLDFGCGTGLSGLALAREGFTMIDGADPSPEMLARARTLGLYRELKQIVPGAALARGYSAIAAIGVLGIGAAPPAVMNQVLAALPPGGLFVFSLNDHALADPAFTAPRDTLLAGNRLISEDYGDHLPGINLKSTVYVVAKS